MSVATFSSIDHRRKCQFPPFHGAYLFIKKLTTSFVIFISRLDIDIHAERCVLCSPFSVQQCGARSKSVSTHASTYPHGLMQCLNCGKHACFSCCSSLHQILQQMLNKPSTLKEERNAIRTSPWFIEVGRLICHPQLFFQSSIAFGSCCEFSASVEKEKKRKANIIFPKFTRHYLPNSVYGRSSSLGSSESESEYVPQKVVLKKFPPPLDEESLTIVPR